jgi:predicted transcriptional regulator
MENKRELDVIGVEVEILEDLQERLDFYRSIEEGLEDVQQGRTQPFKEAIEDIRESIGNSEFY